MIQYGYLKYGNVPSTTHITITVSLPIAYTTDSFSHVISPTSYCVNGSSYGANTSAFNAQLFNVSSTQTNNVNFRYITIGF